MTAIGRAQGRDYWLGCALGMAGAGAPSSCRLTDSTPNAHVAEMDAMAYALATAASGDGRTVTVAFDCQSAAGIAMLTCASHTLPMHARNFAALRTIISHRRNTLHFEHVPAHTGHPLNECSDAVSKAAACGKCHWLGDVEAFAAAFRDGCLANMRWPVAESFLATSLPA